MIGEMRDAETLLMNPHNNRNSEHCHHMNTLEGGFT